MIFRFLTLSMFCASLLQTKSIQAIQGVELNSDRTYIPYQLIADGDYVILNSAGKSVYLKPVLGRALQNKFSFTKTNVQWIKNEVLVLMGFYAAEKIVKENVATESASENCRVCLAKKAGLADQVQPGSADPKCALCNPKAPKAPKAAFSQGALEKAAVTVGLISFFDFLSSWVVEGSTPYYTSHKGKLYCVELKKDPGLFYVQEAVEKLGRLSPEDMQELGGKVEIAELVIPNQHDNAWRQVSSGTRLFFEATMDVAILFITFGTQNYFSGLVSKTSEFWKLTGKRYSKTATGLFAWQAMQFSKGMLSYAESVINPAFGIEIFGEKKSEIVGVTLVDKKFHFVRYIFSEPDTEVALELHQPLRLP